MQDEKPFSIHTHRVDGCMIVVVHGELDSINAQPLEETLTGCQNGHPVIVDLAAVSFICSASLHVLLRQRPGGRPILAAPSRHIARVLDIIEADRTTSIFSDRAAALASLEAIHQMAS